MGLAKANSVLRYFLLAFSLITLFIDIYFIKTYFEDAFLVFLGAFYVQAGLNFLLVLTYIFTLILGCVHRRQLRRQVQSGYIKSISACGIIGSLIRFGFVILVAGGLLYISVNAMVKQSRSAFQLTASRESREYAPLRSRFDTYDPKNLYNCPPRDDISRPGDWIAPRLLCELDKSAMSLAAIVAFFALIESFTTLIYAFRSQHENAREFDHSQHMSMEEYGAHGRQDKYTYKADHVSGQEADDSSASKLMPRPDSLPALPKE